MEYMKDGEKFAFGVGVDKLAGAGKVSEAVPLTEKKSEGNDSLAVIIAEIAAMVLTAVFGIARGRKKAKKKKKKRK